MTTLTVIAGGPDTGKSLFAEALVAYRPQPMVARDHIRAVLQAPLDEWHVTLATFGMAQALLLAGVDVCAVGWNLEPADREGWRKVADETGATLRWVVVEASAPKITDRPLLACPDSSSCSKETPTLR